MRRQAPLMIGCCVISMIATTAYAQPFTTAPDMPCHDAREIARQLSGKYEEAPVAFGMQTNGNLLQVYASDAKDTWTVVSTTPGGMSCIVAAGKRCLKAGTASSRPERGSRNHR